MKSERKTCNKCLLDDSIEGVILDSNGVCNYCNEYKPIVAYSESQLLKILQKARKKKRIYDALVPLSGGKDSTYVLYLAVKKYNLRVLTYTYDNGFMSDYAKQNIKSSIAKCKIDHIWVKHNEELIHNHLRCQNQFYNTLKELPYVDIQIPAEPHVLSGKLMYHWQGMDLLNQ
jgi:ribosomal protein S8